ncbi:MAG TPA: peroxiredoxin [Albitalea sp.]|nr:peroxiredoxin [Albitalea sp.]
MKRTMAAVLALLVSWPAHAALDIGEPAPAFVTQAAVGGKVFNFSLAEALAKGPVVVYFFPAAFSIGCSIEAHTFAESIGKFEALKATVIGVSGDDIDTLAKFSVQECQSKFPVGTDNTKKIMTSFDAVMSLRPEYANRISFLIAPDGKIVYEYKSLNPFNHVSKVLSALEEWSKAQAAK